MATLPSEMTEKLRSYFMDLPHHPDTAVAELSKIFLELSPKEALEAAAILIRERRMCAIYCAVDSPALLKTILERLDIPDRLKVVEWMPLGPVDCRDKTVTTLAESLLNYSVKNLDSFKRVLDLRAIALSAHAAVSHPYGRLRRSALHEAAQHNGEVLMYALKLFHPTTPDVKFTALSAQDLTGQTVLHYAIRHLGEVEAIMTGLSVKQQVDLLQIKDFLGQTPLELAKKILVTKTKELTSLTDATKTEATQALILKLEAAIKFMTDAEKIHSAAAAQAEAKAAPGGGGGGKGLYPTKDSARLVASAVYCPGAEKDSSSYSVTRRLGTYSGAEEVRAKFAFAQYSTIGRRPTNEDTEFCLAFTIGEQEYLFTGVCDGHGGLEVAKLAAYVLPIHLADILQEDDYTDRIQEALSLAFKRTEEEIESLDSDSGYSRVGVQYFPGFAQKQGTTVTSALAIHDTTTGKTSYFTANLGDSRTVVCFAREAFDTKDHKPIDHDEKARIEKAKYIIYGKRVSSILAGAQELTVSRALGDLATFNSYGDGCDRTAVDLFHVPTIGEATTTDGEDADFIILACDGLWDVISSEDAYKIVMQLLSLNIHPQVIAAYLANLAMEKGSGDNISVCILPNTEKYPYAIDLTTLSVDEIKRQVADIKIAPITDDSRVRITKIAEASAAPRAAAAAAAAEAEETQTRRPSF